MAGMVPPIVDCHYFKIFPSPAGWLPDASPFSQGGSSKALRDWSTGLYVRKKEQGQLPKLYCTRLLFQQNFVGQLEGAAPRPKIQPQREEAYHWMQAPSAATPFETLAAARLYAGRGIGAVF